MVGSDSRRRFAGVCALLTIMAAPFELTHAAAAPAVAVGQQRRSGAGRRAFASWLGAALVWCAGSWPRWRTPLTAPWVALLAAMLIAAP